MAFLVHRCRGMLTRTKLVKLMYMADYEGWRFLGGPISSFYWTRRDYGPFDPQFYQVAETLEERGLLFMEPQPSPDPEADPWYRYTPKGDLPESSFSAAETRILEAVLEAYGAMKTEKFVKEVVYQTTPFLAVKNHPQRTPIPMEIVEGEGAGDIDGLDLAAIERGRERIRSGRGIPLADALSAIRGRG